MATDIKTIAFSAAREKTAILICFFREAIKGIRILGHVSKDIQIKPYEYKALSKLRRL